MKSIKELKTKDLKGKRVIVRVDYNVPVSKGEVVDTFRIEKSLATINYLREKGAKVLLVSHIGEDGKESLLPVARFLAGFFPVNFVKELNEAAALLAAKENAAVLLENIRRFPGEKENDQKLAKDLAALADFYVNEAFSVSHRAHASIVGVPKFLPSYAGLEFEEEVKKLSKLFQPKKPFIVVLGGVKFTTKVPLVKKFLPLADQIFIGGALASSFFKSQGYETGESVTEEDVSILNTLVKNPKILLPGDVVVKGRRGLRVTQPEKVKKEEKIVDVGPETLKMLKKITQPAKTVLWNGPLGWFEKGFCDGTDDLARHLSQTKAYTVVGGGDTLASIQNLNLLGKFGFVSTGGGALLEFLGTGTLPGLKALES